MIRTFGKHSLVWMLSCLLVFTAAPLETSGQQPAPNGYSGQGAPLSANELQQLVAPIALYPDALVAQVLGAATFPDQITAASSWLQQNRDLTGSTLMTAVDFQPWDPSVKALTQFPSVLDNLAKNLSWTSALGEAYHTQSAGVMTAVQVLRAKAYSAGNLQSGSQITVVQQSPQVIVIQPTNPQVVYVPQYNPAVVYGTPYVTPGYSTAAVVATGMLAFAAGIAVGAAISGGGCCGWGYSSWNCNWHGGAVLYGGTSYYGNNVWHGGYYGSSATAYGSYGATRVSGGYNPSTGTYARGATTVTPYGTQRVGQSYNPYTGAYGATHQVSNAYGSYGSSVYSKNGQTTYTQHASNAYGSTGSFQSSNGARGVASSGVNGNYAAGQAANGNKYAAANGNVYQNTGNGWKQTQGSSNYSSGYNHSSFNNSSYSNAESKGWGSGSEDRSFGSAFGGNGWQSRTDSARGWQSRGGGGGWGGGGWRGRR